MPGSINSSDNGRATNKDRSDLTSHSTGDLPREHHPLIPEHQLRESSHRKVDLPSALLGEGMFNRRDRAGVAPSAQRADDEPGAYPSLGCTRPHGEDAALGLAPFKVVVPASLPLLGRGALERGRRKADTRRECGQAERST